MEPEIEMVSPDLCHHMLPGPLRRMERPFISAIGDPMGALLTWFLAYVFKIIL
jgi:hypothetical protein